MSHRPHQCGWHVRDHIIYAPRGHRWTWHDTTFLAVGGAYSIDRGDREEGVDWWPQEMITDDEVELAIAGGKTDVLLCHDAPLDVPDLPGTREQEKMVFPQTVANRTRLDKVARHTLPKHIFHGHYHVAARSVASWPFYFDGKLYWTDTIVHSLSYENRQGSWELFPIP